MILGNIKKGLRLYVEMDALSLGGVYFEGLSFPFYLFINFCGCSATKNEVAETKQNVVSVKNTTFQNVDKQTGQEISQHLVELSTSIPNVNDATAVVLGPYAIVGIDVNQNLDRSEVGSIKYSVAESLKNDPHGANSSRSG